MSPQASLTQTREQTTDATIAGRANDRGGTCHM